MTVRVEKDGPITTVILSRPQVRNAVDWQTAAALAKIFRDFDADDTAKVAVLYGDHGVFCAGADLKAHSLAGLRGVNSVVDSLLMTRVPMALGAVSFGLVSEATTA
jgi:enoyl-CoA hydratase